MRFLGKELGGASLAARQTLNTVLLYAFLPIKAKNKLRLLPALNIPMEDLKAAVEIIKDVCAAK